MHILGLIFAFSFQFFLVLFSPRLSCRPSCVSLLKACLRQDSKCSLNLSLIHGVRPYFPKDTSLNVLSTSSLHFTSCAMYSTFNTALIVVCLGYGNISEETKCLQKLTWLLHKIALISLCQIICEVRMELLIVQLQSQGIQEETMVEVNKICVLKERKLFLVTFKCKNKSQSLFQNTFFCVSVPCARALPKLLFETLAD